MRFPKTPKREKKQLGLVADHAQAKSILKLKAAPNETGYVLETDDQYGNVLTTIDTLGNLNIPTTLTVGGLIYGSYLAPTAIQNSNYVANPGDFVVVDCSSGNVTVQLPPNNAVQTVTLPYGTTSWTCPADTYSVIVQCWGAGGGGGGYTAAAIAASGGGGGASSKSTLTVVPGTIYPISIGSGGTDSTGNNGTSGGDTWFSTSGTILAKGGAGGNTNSSAAVLGGQSSSGIGSTKFSGGNGGSTTNNFGFCSGGSSAGTAAAGNNGTSGGGNITAPSGGGYGGSGGYPSGVGGGVPGGGGGGAQMFSGATSGGQGGNGQIILNYTSGYPEPANASQIGVKLVKISSSYTCTVETGPSDYFNINNTGPQTFTISTVNQAALWQYNASNNVWYEIVNDSFPAGSSNDLQVNGGSGLPVGGRGTLDSSGNLTALASIVATTRATSGVTNAGSQSGGTYTTDASQANLVNITVGAALTLSAPTNAISGQMITWNLLQPASGGPFSWSLASGTGGFITPTSIVLTPSTTASVLDSITAVYDSAVSKWRIIEFTRGDSLTLGITAVKHLVGNSTAPTIAAGAGAGTSPTISIIGTDLAGQVTLTTGTLPTGGAVVFTVTFNAAFTAAPYVNFSPVNSNAAALSGLTMVYVTSTMTTFVFTVGATGLVAATQYIWNYTVIA